MVESAPQSAILRTGETGADANTTECLGYGDGGNGRWRQLEQREKLSKTENLAPRRGFEPQFTAPKAAVLPLDDRGMASRWDCLSSVPVCSLCRNVGLLTIPLQWMAEGNLDWCPGRSSKPFGGCYSRWCVRFALSSAIAQRHPLTSENNPLLPKFKATARRSFG